MVTVIEKSLQKLFDYCESEDFKGYDPYDTLNSPLLRKLPGKIMPAVFIQVQKRTPFNIRPFLGIKKEYNPKALGLFLKATCMLYRKTKKPEYLEKAKYFFVWLRQNYSEGYSGYAWGYNFDWASPGNYLKAYTPSVVVTSFVVDGIYEYYQLTGDEKAAEIILSAADYVRNDIPVSNLTGGISFSYTHLSKGACYNASLLAAEILAKAAKIRKNEDDIRKIQQAVQYVIAQQKPDGRWLYSYDPVSKSERDQVDFHQGFILVSLHNLLKLSVGLDTSIESNIIRGLEFYHKNQFFNDGKSHWRLPKTGPADIHNQSQGIITFAGLKEYNPEYSGFANTIAKWTIQNMQHKKGYFYYRIYPFFKNKISFMRWSQAWMLLAFSVLLETHPD